MAKAMRRIHCIDFAGIYTHEIYSGDTPEGAWKLALEVASAMSETAKMLKRAGISISHVSMGP